MPKLGILRIFTKVFEEKQKLRGLGYTAKSELCFSRGFRCDLAVASTKELIVKRRSATTLKGTGTRDLILLKVVSLERS